MYGDVGEKRFVHKLKGQIGSLIKRFKLILN